LDAIDTTIFTARNQGRDQAKMNLKAIRQEFENIVFQACDTLLDKIPIRALRLRSSKSFKG